jgi:hypothetical protein
MARKPIFILSLFILFRLFRFSRRPPFSSLSLMLGSRLGVPAHQTPPAPGSDPLLPPLPGDKVCSTWIPAVHRTPGQGRQRPGTPTSLANNSGYAHSAASRTLTR